MTQYVDVKMAFNGLLNSLEALEEIAKRDSPLPKWLERQISWDVQRLDQMDLNGFDPTCHRCRVMQLGMQVDSTKELWERVRKIPQLKISDTIRCTLETAVNKTSEIATKVWIATMLTKSAILGAPIHKIAFTKEQIEKIKSDECQKDPTFIKELYIAIAGKAPDLLRTLKSLLPPIKTLEEALLIGIYIEKESDRDSFRKSLSPDLEIPKETLEKARETFLKNNSKHDDEVLDIGVCVGHTLALMAQDSPQPNETTLRKARFIQTAYAANGALSEFMSVKLGLKRTHKPFSTVLIDLVTGKDHPVPALILKQFGLKKTGRVFSGSQPKDLFLALKTLEKTQGFFELATAHPGSGHSAYLTLNPPAFCDINAFNYLTMKADFHQFQTVDELIVHISQIIDSFAVSNLACLYDFFALDHYVKVDKEEECKRDC